MKKPDNAPRALLTTRQGIIFLILLFFSGFSAQSTYGQTEHKLVASDGLTSDNFGQSVDIDDQTAIIGARLDDGIVGSNAGSVYIYRDNGTNWVQTQKLIASDGAAGDEFGYSVAIDGNVAIVGSRLDDDNGSSSGSAYVFTFNGTNWIQSQKLIASDGQSGDEFGYSVAVSGNHIIIGARYEDPGSSNAGAAYIYEFNGFIWLQQQKIIASDIGSGDQFGFDVSISGTTAAVGAPLNDDFGTSSGSVYIYTFINGIGWTQQQKLLAPDIAFGDQFGRSVSIFGNRVLIGSPYDDDNGSSSGSADIFNFNVFNWQHQQKLTASDAASGDNFGLDVDLTDRIAIIGAYGNDDNGSSSGSAYLFLGVTPVWTPIGKLTASDAASFDYYGYSVAAHDSTGLIGAYGDDPGGSAYISEFEPPENDLCSGALNITCGQTISGNTSTASKTDAPANCTVSLNSAPGIWYRFTGTGESMEASLCGSAYDTKIGVFSGTCGSLTCVAGNDDLCNLQSQVTFPTTLGTNYYIYVTGYNTLSGAFNLSLNCFAPINDLCANALPVACGSTIVESTANATTISAPSSCVVSLNTAPGLWYTLPGSGDEVTLSLCNSSYDTKIGVFAGNCIASACIAGNDDDCGLLSEVTFQTFAGINYLIYITGFQIQSGLFELEVDCSPGNDLCSTAVPIACGETVSGNTNTSTNTGNPGSCNSLNLGTAPGLWYTFTGTGDQVELSTCGSGFDTQLGVYTGSCGNFTCVAVNDDACSLQSELTFASATGTNYYIYVTGYQALSGGFNLSLECSPINDLCADAIVVSCGSTVSGSTVNGSNTDEPAVCNFITNTAAGVWYQFAGSDNTVTVSLCNSLYDTQLGIYTGNCSALVCLTGNDDECGPQGQMLLSEVTFDAMAGTDYYIYITGYAGQEGDYTMDISCTPLNDNCTDAIPVACGTTIPGSTIGATAQSGLPSCSALNLGSGPGIWYSFVGGGENVMATTCGNADYDTQLGIYTNTCGALACVAENDDACSLQSTVTFLATPGQLYYIYVTGYQALSGNFQLTVSCGAPPCDVAPIASSTDITENSVKLNWTPTPGALAYRIKGSEVGSPIITIEVGSSPTYIDVGNLSLNTSYIWTVRAICDSSGSAVSPISNVDSFTTLPGCPTPGATFSSNVTASSATLNWTPTPAAIAYRISGNAVGITPDVNIILSGGSTSSFTVSNLAANTSYSWTIRALCLTGNSNLAAQDTFTTLMVAKNSPEMNPAVTHASFDFKMYPNPASAIVHISLPESGTEHVLPVRLFDQKGKLVFSMHIQMTGNTGIINIPAQLNNGVYHIEIFAGDRFIHKKLVLVR